MGNNDSYNTIYQNSVYISVSNNSDIKKFVAHKIIGCDLLATFHIFILKTSKNTHVVIGNYLPPTQISTIAWFAKPLAMEYS
jgi:hypothetical protein